MLEKEEGEVRYDERDGIRGHWGSLICCWVKINVCQSGTLNEEGWRRPIGQGDSMRRETTRQRRSSGGEEERGRRCRSKYGKGWEQL